MTLRRAMAGGAGNLPTVKKTFKYGESPLFKRLWFFILFPFDLELFLILLSKFLNQPIPLWIHIN